MTRHSCCIRQLEVAWHPRKGRLESKRGDDFYQRNPTNPKKIGKLVFFFAISLLKFHTLKGSYAKLSLVAKGPLATTT